MEELMLERYFDEFIANPISLKTEEAETERQPFLLLNDKLQDKEDNRGSSTLHQSPEIRNSLQSSSQNASGAAALRAYTSESQMKVEEQEKEVLPPIISKVHNVMAYCDVGCSLDLHFITSHTWNAVYNPRKFQGAVVRLRKPRITANIFRSGKITFYGSTSAEESRCGARRVVRKLQKLGLCVTFRNFKVCSMMATCQMFPVRLEEIQRSYPTQCSYEPELFPGLHFKVRPGLSLTIHFSGKITATGSHNPEEAQRVFESICPILTPFRRIVIPKPLPIPRRGLKRSRLRRKRHHHAANQ